MVVRRVASEWSLPPVSGIARVPVVDAETASAKAAIEKALAELEETWGVKVLGVRLTAAGHMLDFRYRICEPDKATALFDRLTKPYLVDEASGTKLAVPNPPKVGPLRARSKPEANR